MLHGEPEYRRRRREKAAQNQHYADPKWYEAAQDARVEKVIASVKNVTEQLERAIDENAPKNKSERRRHRLEIGGLWAAAAVGAAAIFIGNQDAKHQRDIMQNTLDEMRTEQRPWVYVTGTPEIYQGLEIVPPNGAQIHVRFSLENSGRVPATDTRVAIRFINNANGWPFDREGEQRTACDITVQKGTWVSANATVFPGRPQEVDAVSVMDQRQVEIAAKGTMPPSWQYSPNIPGILSPFIVGCIQYRFASGGGWHVTPIDYYVTYVDAAGQPKDSRIAIPFADIRMTIPPDRLRLLEDAGAIATPPS